MFKPTKNTMEWYWKAIKASQESFNKGESADKELWSKVELIAEMFERSEAQVWVDISEYGKWN